MPPFVEGTNFVPSAAEEFWNIRHPPWRSVFDLRQKLAQPLRVRLATDWFCGTGVFVISPDIFRGCSV
jgi:hypothetical protein